MFCIIHCSHIIRRKLKPIEKAETSLKFALFGKMQVLLDKFKANFVDFSANHDIIPTDLWKFERK